MMTKKRKVFVLLFRRTKPVSNAELNKIAFRFGDILWKLRYHPHNLDIETMPMGSSKSARAAYNSGLRHYRLITPRSKIDFESMEAKL